MLTEMDIKKIANLYTEDVISVKNLNGFHNHVYEVNGDSTFILRISERQHEEATKSEIDFLLYLYSNDVPVAPPIISLNRLYVNRISIDSTDYVASAFKKSDGKDFRTRDIDEKNRFEIIGRTLGKVHRLSKAYAPAKVEKRRHWSENPHLKKASCVFSKYNPDLLEKFNSYMALMSSFPQNKNSFGLVHGDFLFSNYFFDDSNNITIFDFDECEYSWYLYDIAVCMYYYLLGGDPKELNSKAEEAEALFYNIILGYKTECEIDSECLKNFDLFFQMREYVLLSSILETSMDRLNGWSKDFAEGAVNRQLKGKPFIDIDFLGIYNSIESSVQK